MPAATLESIAITIVACIPRISCASSDGPKVTDGTPASANSRRERIVRHRRSLAGELSVSQTEHAVDLLPGKLQTGNRIAHARPPSRSLKGRPPHERSGSSAETDRAQYCAQTPKAVATTRHSTEYRLLATPLRRSCGFSVLFLRTPAQWVRQHQRPRFPLRIFNKVISFSSSRCASASARGSHHGVRLRLDLGKKDVLSASNSATRNKPCKGGLIAPIRVWGARPTRPNFPIRAPAG